MDRIELAFDMACEDAIAGGKYEAVADAQAAEGVLAFAWLAHEDSGVRSHARTVLPVVAGQWARRLRGTPWHVLDRHFRIGADDMWEVRDDLRKLAESFGPMTFAEWCAMDDQIGLMVCGLMTEAEAA